MFAELGLQHIERFRRSQSLDRGDLGAVGLDGKRQAGAHAVAVHQYGTRPADAVLAPDVSASQSERLAQEIGQQEPRLDIGPIMPRSIDCQ